MKSSTQRIIRLILLAVILYLTTLGATFNGILALPQFQPITVFIFASVASGWLWWHRQRAWFRTPLDIVLVIWAAAFMLSIVANPVTARRSAEALWYMGLYAALWYLLCDLVSHGFSRRSMSEAFVFSSVVVVAFGILQTVNLLMMGGDLRPVSLIGNPNALGVYLVVLIPFILVPAWTTKKRPLQIILGGYASLALALLLATTSRGAWLGGIAAMSILLALMLAQAGMLSKETLLLRWRTQSPRRKMLLGAALGMGFLALLVVGAVILQSFSSGSRSADLRLYLWEAALRMFSEKPLTGHGLFTYGYHLARFDSIPPGQPHSHAHNLLLTILAELGVPGLIAIFVSIGVMLRAGWHNWYHLPAPERPVWMAAVAALGGFAVHHLFDTPAMMPLIALTGLWVLVVVVTPAQPIKMSAHWRKIGHPLGMALLWFALLIIGFWHASFYSNYYMILTQAVQERTFAESASALQSLIEADPYQPAYHLQQGYLYGRAAGEGDARAVQLAIDAYTRYLALEPYQAAAWSNLAALHWQKQDTAAALAAVQQARQLAPRWDIFERQQQLYSGVLTGGLRIAPEKLESLWGVNMARFQYLRDVIGTQFLPQVGW